MFASGKSLRGSPEKDMIKNGCPNGKIGIEFVSEKSEGITRSMSVSFLGNNRKVMRYGYSDVPRMSDMLGISEPVYLRRTIFHL